MYPMGGLRLLSDYVHVKRNEKASVANTTDMSQNM